MMNNKMAINTYLSRIESKKQTKQTRRTETESWIQRVFGWLQDGRGCGGMGEEVRGLRNTNRTLAGVVQWIEHQPSEGRQFRSQLGLMPGL